MNHLARRAALTLALGLGLPLLAAAQTEPRAGDVAVVSPWSRAALQGGSAAAFMTLRNTGSAPDRLVSATSPAAGRLELHHMVRNGDVMQMRPVPNIEVPAGGTVELRPGGFHVMLLGLTAALPAGGTLPLSLTFERGGTVQVQVPVAAAGAAAAPGGHGHGHMPAR